MRPHPSRVARPPVTLILILALSGPTVVSAGPAPGQAAVRPRPRIGLALGGGSARGLAHVGVLEWLHEHRVPVDAVAGTSIGGLVGGFYATGLTVPELIAMTAETDWDAVLAADTPFEDKTFRRKEDRRALPARVEFGLRRGLSLPRSLNPAQRVALLIDRVTLPYSAAGSFDDLPTPFRCVAFDLDRAEPAVLERGVLAEAMLATMALPGIFPPVTIDGRLLLDGGFTDNLPADVARRMNVDVVIAVDVGGKATDDSSVTALSMVSRAIDAVMAIGTNRSRQAADLVISPDLSRLSSTNWRAAAEYRVRGYRAAEGHAAELLQYALDQAGYDAHEAARLARRRVAPIVPRAIRVSGVGPMEGLKVLEALRAAPGNPLDTAALDRDLLRLSGTDRYELLTYNLASNASGTDLVIAVRPKANGPAFLTLGVEMNNVDASSFTLNLLGRTTIYDAAGGGSEARLDFAVGTRQEASAELYRPIGVPWLFAAPRAFAAHGPRGRFEGGRRVGEYGVTRAGAALDVGVTFARVGELRVGIEAAHVEEGLRVGDPSLPIASGWERVASARLTLDSQDSAVVPSRGTFARAGVRRYFAAPRAADAIAGHERFWQADADSTTFASLTERDRVFVRASGGTSFGAQPYFDDFALGGPFRMSAFSNDELRGAHFGLAAAGYLRRLSGFPAWVGGRAYVATWVEAGSAFQSRDGAVWRADAAAGVIVDSMIGPLFVGGSVGPEGHRRLYVSLGPVFR